MSSHIIYRDSIYDELVKLSIFPHDLENIIYDFLPEIECNIKSIIISNGPDGTNGIYTQISPFTYSNEKGSIWKVDPSINNILGGIEGWIIFCGCIAMDTSFWIESKSLAPPKIGWKSYFHQSDMNGAGKIRDCLIRGSVQSSLKIDYN